jgi:transcriptional regulator with XRE-family HTH domain
MRDSLTCSPLACQAPEFSVEFLRMAVARELAVVVGRNCEQIRNLIGITQDDLARYARDLGLRWKASSVGDFEAGRSAPKFSTVVTVAAALQLALERAIKNGKPNPFGEHGVTLAMLMRHNGYVQLTETFRVTGRFLVDACSGQVVSLKSPTYDHLRVQGVVTDAVTDILRRSGLAEQRQAKRLGIKPEALAALSLILWQRPFSEERDRRAGGDANQQKRGQITRALQAELAEALPKYTTRVGELTHLAGLEIWASNGND